MRQALCAVAKRTSLSGILVACLAAGLGYSHPASAQGTGTGPVASQCTSEIKAYCADKEHGAGEVRACLEANRSHLSAPCTHALGTTGGGRGRNPTR